MLTVKLASSAYHQGLRGVLWVVKRPLSHPVWDSTTPAHPEVDRRRRGSSVPGEQPRSSPSLGTVVVAPCRHSGARRVYDKTHYCLYCSRPYAKIVRHLEGAHGDKSDVAQALSLPKGSKERKRRLDHIRNRGNYAHNTSVMQSGDGAMVPFRRPPQEARGQDFMHCVYYQGLYLRKLLWRHMHACPFKPGSVVPGPGRNRVQSMCAYTGPVPATLNERLWTIVSSMSPDPISRIIKTEPAIIEFGQRWLNKRGTSAKSEEDVCERMRDLGCLVQGARTQTSLKTMEDFIHPENELETVRAVQWTCRRGRPPPANLWRSLVEVSRLFRARGFMSNNQKLVQDASSFEAVHKYRWREWSPAAAGRTGPSVLACTRDVQTLHAYLTQEQGQMVDRPV